MEEVREAVQRGGNLLEFANGNLRVGEAGIIKAL